jgi:hypothetical protein
MKYNKRRKSFLCDYKPLSNNMKLSMGNLNVYVKKLHTPLSLEEKSGKNESAIVYAWGVQMVKLLAEYLNIKVKVKKDMNYENWIREKLKCQLQEIEHKVKEEMLDVVKAVAEAIKEVEVSFDNIINLLGKIVPDDSRGRISINTNELSIKDEPHKKALDYPKEEERRKPISKLENESKELRAEPKEQTKPTDRTSKGITRITLDTIGPSLKNKNELIPKEVLKANIRLNNYFGLLIKHSSSFPLPGAMYPYARAFEGKVLILKYRKVFID